MSREILDIPMEENDADAATIRDYLKLLLVTVWQEEESFSGKRPFGNSGWQWDVYKAMIRAGLVAGTVDENGEPELPMGIRSIADRLIVEAIRSLN